MSTLYIHKAIGGFMLKDRRDDFDDNEDVDLTGMIHQYNEDNELRRKINEMKKQKENDAQDFDPNDSALMGNAFSSKDETRIPDIKVDHDIEKTRVGFNDDSDKTLVIMDRKTRVDANSEDVYEDYSYVEPQKNTTAFRQVKDEEEVDDLRDVVKTKKNKKEVHDDADEDEKTKRINKIIMITIISIISVVLLVGIGFGVKYAFFNNDTKDSETDKDKEETKDKKPTNNKNNNKDKDDIDDNSAVITQLRTQLNTYQTQLNEVNSKLVTAQSQVNLYQGKLDAIAVLKTNLDTATTNVNSANTEYTKAQAAKKVACDADKTSSACAEATQAETDAYAAFNKAKTDQVTSQQAYDSEYNQTADYKGKLKSAQETYDALNTQKTDLEKKVADTTTKLAKYE